MFASFSHGHENESRLEPTYYNRKMYRALGKGAGKWWWQHMGAWSYVTKTEICGLMKCALEFLIFIQV